MANFKTHLTGGFLVSSLAATICYKAGIVEYQDLILCIVIGTIGGLLPDIDSNHSKPIILGFNAISISAALFVIIHFRSKLPLLYLLLFAVLSFIFIRYFVFICFTKLTKHRGIIHSIPYMAMVAMGVVWSNAYYLDTPIINSWLYGMFLFIGSMVHLTLDELYGVDLVNIKIKRSFGTALKLFSKNDAGYFLLVYAILSYLILNAPPFNEFWSTLTDPITWMIVKKSLI